jgi:hypothetical protein
MDKAVMVWDWESVSTTSFFVDSSVLIDVTGSTDIQSGLSRVLYVH